MREYGATGTNHAHEIEVHYFFPVIICDVKESVSIRRDGGVVDQNVDLAKGVNCGLNSLAWTVSGGEIYLVSQNLIRGSKSCDGGGIQIRTKYSAAFGNELARDCVTNSPASPGDNGHFSR